MCSWCGVHKINDNYACVRQSCLKLSLNCMFSLCHINSTHREDPKMNWTLYLMLSVLTLYPRSVITIGDQGKTADAVRVRTLQGGDAAGEQCPPEEERERARNEIRQSISSVITTLGATTMHHSTNDNHTKYAHCD